MSDILNNLSVVRVEAANRLTNVPVGVKVVRKDRERWAVTLKTAGKTVYSCNGAALPSDPCHVVVLPRGCSYSWECVEPGECLMVEFEAEGSADRAFSYELPDSSPIRGAFSRIERALTENAPDGPLECRFELYGIFLHLVKSRKRNYQPSSKMQMLAPAVSYIQNHYSDREITSSSLAERCGVSNVWFRKTFEKIYGMPPMRYLSELRLGKAQQILRSDYASITQVAENVGFGSVYHFSRMFKEKTGMSPGEYAKSSRG